MADLVQYKKGLSSAYKALVNKDENTFYYTTDDKQVYLGEICLTKSGGGGDHGDLTEIISRIAKNEEDIADIYAKLDEFTDGATVSLHTLQEKVVELEEKVAEINDTGTGILAQAKEYTNDKVDAALTSVYVPSGSISDTAELPEPDLSTLGYLYSLDEDIVTTDDFVGGAGQTILEGSQISVVQVRNEDTGEISYKYDIVSGVVDLTGYATTNDLTNAQKSAIETSNAYTDEAMLGLDPKGSAASAEKNAKEYAESLMVWGNIE